MRLKILLPHRVFLDAPEVSRIVAATTAGSLGILPRRLDFAATLRPGILEYTAPSGDMFVALDEGLLVKAGDEVTAAVRDAAGGAEGGAGGGADPGSLRTVVEEEFKAREEEQKIFREALARFEGEFVRRFLETERHG